MAADIRFTEPHVGRCARSWCGFARGVRTPELRGPGGQSVAARPHHECASILAFAAPSSLWCRRASCRTTHGRQRQAAVTEQREPTAPRERVGLVLEHLGMHAPVAAVVVEVATPLPPHGHPDYSCPMPTDPQIGAAVVAVSCYLNRPDAFPGAATRRADADDPVAADPNRLRTDPHRGMESGADLLPLAVHETRAEGSGLAAPPVAAGPAVMPPMVALRRYHAWRCVTRRQRGRRTQRGHRSRLDERDAHRSNQDRQAQPSGHRPMLTATTRRRDQTPRRRSGRTSPTAVPVPRRRRSRRPRARRAGRGAAGDRGARAGSGDPGGTRLDVWAQPPNFCPNPEQSPIIERNRATRPSAPLSRATRSQRGIRWRRPSRTTWPVTPEVAGSSPVARAPTADRHSARCSSAAE
jgi:hypothetical protein